MNEYSFTRRRRVIANRRDELKYDAILRAAITVMAQAGYHHAQISRIAKVAGVADGTVYLYFKNKEDILISLIRSCISQIVKRSTEELLSGMKAAEKLSRLVALYFGELGSDADLAMVTQVHLRQVDANIRRQIGDIMKPFYDTLDEVVNQGIEEGFFRPGINRRLARRMLFGTMDETVTAWVLTGSKYDLEAQSSDVVDLLLHGLTVSQLVKSERSANT
jgi:TetR/AcrR family fatty acid metabolism transcriptional regulator